MTRALALLTALALIAPASAGEPACGIPDAWVTADFAAPKSASALQKKHMKIVVVGTSSSMPPGSSAAKSAYPAQLEAALMRRHPGASIRVANYAKPRQTAAEMAAAFARIAMDEKPDLVVWQSGIVDALRGIDPEAFRVTLVTGTDILRSAGADVMLMNMQYSPRTEMMIAASSYADAMRWVSLQHEVPLFDRLGIMKFWHEHGTFDLLSPTKRLEVAEQVHACIGQLLASYIDSAIGITDAPSAEGVPPKDDR